MPPLEDVDGGFPFQSVVNFAKASGRSKELDAIMGETGEMVKAQNEYLASHTVSSDPTLKLRTLAELVR